jgi:integrase
MSDESKLGTIEERNGKFRVRLPRALDPERTSRTFESRELAEKFLRGASAVLQDDSPHGHDTLASYVPDWLDRRELGGVRAVARERSVWRCHIEPSKLARMPLASIEKADVRAWLDALAKKPAERKGHLGDKARTLSKQTREHALKLLRGALADARERGAIDEDSPDPTLGLKLGREARTDDAWTFLSLAEIASVIEHKAVPEWFKNIFVVGVYTGLRTGELWGLRWADVVLEGERAELVVRFSHDGPTKSGRVRRVPLLAPAFEVLRRMRASLPKTLHPERLVFTTKRGCAFQKSDDAGWGDRRVPPYYARRYEARGEKAPEKVDGWKTVVGITRPVRFYDATRHTFASHLVMGSWGAQWTLHEVAAMLGHTEVEVTQRYAHLSPDHLARKASMTRGFGDQRLVPSAVVGPSASVQSPAEKPGRAILDSNQWPSAPEADALSN